MKTGKYGEPWEIAFEDVGESGIFNTDNEHIASAISKFEGSRILACVNALACRDPAKLDDAIRTHRNLVKAVTDYVETPRPDVVTDEYIDELVRRGKAMGEAYSASIAALAAFQGGGEE